MKECFYGRKNRLGSLTKYKALFYNLNSHTF